MPGAYKANAYNGQGPIRVLRAQYHCFYFLFVGFICGRSTAQRGSLDNNGELVRRLEPGSTAYMQAVSSLCSVGEG